MSESADSSEAIRSYLAGELTMAMQKKSSLETRGLAFLTANLATATLAMVLQLQFNMAIPTRTGPVNTILLIGLIASFISVVSGAAVAVPMKYTALKIKALKLIGDREDWHEPKNIVAVMGDELASIEKQNSTKARALSVSVISYGAAICLLILAIAASGAGL